MISGLFHTIFYDPIYNGLIFLTSNFSWVDLGVAVVLITIIVKLILFPLTKSSIKTQIKVKEIEPEIEKIKKEYKDDKEGQAKKVMEIYKDNEINPFASFLLLLIQLPVLLALYFVFIKGGLPSVNMDLLYSFVEAPEVISDTVFLGFIDMTQKSFILAILAGVSQFFQIRLVMPKIKEKNGKKDTLKDDLVRNMQLQMKYIMPIFIFFIALGFPSVLALYWFTSNIFMIGQELYIRRRIRPIEK